MPELPPISLKSASSSKSPFVSPPSQMRKVLPLTMWPGVVSPVIAPSSTRQKSRLPVQPLSDWPSKRDTHLGPPRSPGRKGASRRRTRRLERTNPIRRLRQALKSLHLGLHHVCFSIERIPPDEPSILFSPHAKFTRASPWTRCRWRVKSRCRRLRPRSFCGSVQGCALESIWCVLRSPSPRRAHQNWHLRKRLGSSKESSGFSKMRTFEIGARLRRKLRTFEPGALPWTRCRLRVRSRNRWLRLRSYCRIAGQGCALEGSMCIHHVPDRCRESRLPLPQALGDLAVSSAAGPP